MLWQKDGAFVMSLAEGRIHDMRTVRYTISCPACAPPDLVTQVVNTFVCFGGGLPRARQLLHLVQFMLMAILRCSCSTLHSVLQRIYLYVGRCLAQPPYLCHGTVL